MGRPRMAADTRRAARISIHWRPGELERVTKASDMLGLPLADFLRMAGLERSRTVIETSANNPWSQAANGGGKR